MQPYRNPTNKWDSVVEPTLAREVTRTRVSGTTMIVYMSVSGVSGGKPAGFSCCCHEATKGSAEMEAAAAIIAGLLTVATTHAVEHNKAYTRVVIVFWGVGSCLFRYSKSNAGCAGFIHAHAVRRRLMFITEVECDVFGS